MEQKGEVPRHSGSDFETERQNSAYIDPQIMAATLQEGVDQPVISLEASLQILEPLMKKLLGSPNLNEEDKKTISNILDKIEPTREFLRRYIKRIQKLSIALEKGESLPTQVRITKKGEPGYCIYDIGVPQPDQTPSPADTQKPDAA